MTKGWAIFWSVVIAVVVPFGTAAGIGLYQLSKICYQMGGFKITAFDRNNLYMDIAIRIVNKSFLNLTIKSYDLNFYLNGVKVSNIVNKESKDIIPSAASTLVSTISVSFKETFGVVKSADLITNFATMQYDKITLSVDGEFKGRLLKIPFTYKLKQTDWSWTLDEILKMMKEPSVPCQ